MEYQRLRFVATVAVSNVDKKVRDGEIGVWLCNYVDVYYHESIVDSLDFMSATATRDQVSRFSLRQGDILITKDSETPSDIAVPAQVAADMPDIVCGYHLAVVRPHGDAVSSRYLFWVLAASTSRQYFSAAAQGITRFGLRRDAILDLPVPMRDRDSQARLATFLDEQTARVDRLVVPDRRPSAEAAAGEIGTLVNLLRERRQALITAAVTGQLEIPRVAA